MIAKNLIFCALLVILFIAYTDYAKAETNIIVQPSSYGYSHHSGVYSGRGIAYGAGAGLGYYTMNLSTINQGEFVMPDLPEPLSVKVLAESKKDKEKWEALFLEMIEQ